MAAKKAKRGREGDSPLDTVRPGGVVHGNDAIPLRTNERHVVRQTKADLLKLCQCQLLCPFVRGSCSCTHERRRRRCPDAQSRAEDC